MTQYMDAINLFNAEQTNRKHKHLYNFQLNSCTSLGSHLGYKGHQLGAALILSDVGWIARDVLEYCSHVRI